jgi:DNA repair protein RadC
MATEKRLKMKDLPESERPYEKMEKMGPEMLSNAELLAIVLRTGNKEETSVMLAQKVLNQDGDKGFAYLYDLSIFQLRSIKGVGRVKALQIKALLEISKRISSTYRLEGRIIIKSPEDVVKLLMEEMRYLKKEVFKIVMLNTKNHVVRIEDISIGSLTSSIVHPREVFTEPVKTCCSGLIFVHNHPSGDPEPSNEDIETTVRLVDAGNILGIKVLDHVVIGEGRFVSFKGKGLI